MNRAEQVAAEYTGRRVIVKHSDKAKYASLIGQSGTVLKTSGTTIGVKMDDDFNEASSYGVYWFKPSELRIIDPEYLVVKQMEQERRKRYANYAGRVAIVTLFGDTEDKEYKLALDPEDFINIRKEVDGSPVPGQLVVGNPKHHLNRLLYSLKRIEVFREPTAVVGEVVGVVNADRYLHEEQVAVIKSRLLQTRRAMDIEIEKLEKKEKTIDYYKEIADNNPSNQTLQDLFSELTKLEEQADELAGWDYTKIYQ